MARNYWMVVQTTEDFETSREMGFTLHGLRFSQRRRAQRMEPQDSLLYYVSGTRKWSAIATVTSTYFEDRTPIWQTTGSNEEYPYRVKLEPALVLDEKDYIDALLLAPRLEYLKRWAPERWAEAFVDTLHLLPQRDFRLIEGEMKRVHPKWKNKRRSRRQPQIGNRGRHRDFHADVDGPTLMYEPPSPVDTDAPLEQQPPAPVEGAEKPQEWREEHQGSVADAQVAEHEPRLDAEGDTAISDQVSSPEADIDDIVTEHEPILKTNEESRAIDRDSRPDGDEAVQIPEQTSNADAEGDGPVAEMDIQADIVSDDGPSVEQASDPQPDDDTPTLGYRPTANEESRAIDRDSRPDGDEAVQIPEQASDFHAEGNGPVAEMDTQADMVSDDGPPIEQASEPQPDDDTPTLGYKSMADPDAEGDISE